MDRWGRNLRAVAVGMLAVVIVTACGSSADVAVRPARVVFTVPEGATAAQTATTAARMQARYRALGAPEARVAAHGRRLVVSGPPSVRGLTNAVSTRGRLEFCPVLAVVARDAVPSNGSDVPLPPATGGPNTPSYVVGPAAITGGVASAKAVRNTSFDGWTVIMRLTSDGNRRFNALARASFEQQPPRNAVAIVLDRRVQSAPSFQTPSFSGDVEISGDFTRRDAERLAAVLQTGAYPVPVALAA